MSTTESKPSLTVGQRYAARLARTGTVKPSAIWNCHDLPPGWSTTATVLGSMRVDFIYAWSACHRAGAVDHKQFTKRWQAAKRAWELAAQAEEGLQHSAA